MGKILTINEFIDRAKKIHGEKYDYSLVEYKNSSTKIKIICPEHGVFEQTPNNHTVQKQGCGKCGGKHKTVDDFILKSKEIHCNKYDYSLVDYKNNKIKVDIICPEHGCFEQKPNSHLNGSGCPRCNDAKKTNEIFIKEAKNVHGEKYDYSLVNYKNNKTKIKIICKEHGVIEQLPNDHLNGCGCGKCFGRDKTTESYIKEAKKIHGDKYDYSLIEYKGAFEKIKIICPKHGEFTQSATGHLSRMGCPSCKKSSGENIIHKFLLQNKLNFIPQKTFKGCKDKRLLPFDFYLPELSICIEYDGRQHFEEVEIWGGLEHLLDTQRKDEIKNNFCKQNGIILIRISYKEDIINKLKENLIECHI